MPLTEYKVTPEEQAQQGVVAEVGNKLNGTVAQNKAVFDRLCNFLIAKYNQVLDLIYTKEETNAQINAKITEIGSGDMAQSVYDPTGQKKDIFEEIIKKANSTHTHTVGDIPDFPTSLPASGGNADTLGGMSNAKFMQWPNDTISTDLLEWAATINVPTKVRANTSATNVPYSASWIVTLDIGGVWKTLTLVDVSRQKVYVANQTTTGGAWSAWRGQTPWVSSSAPSASQSIAGDLWVW